MIKRNYHNHAKTEWLALFLIILVSLTFQTVVVFRNRVPDYDEAIYYDTARNIVKTGLPVLSDGKGTVFFHHPSLPFYLMAIPLSISPSLVLGRALGSFLGVFIIVFTYLIAKNLSSSKTGLLAAFLLAIHPLFLTFAHSLYIEAYLGFFIMASCLSFFLAEERKKTGFYLLAGVFLGLALLTKYLAASLFLSYFIFFLFKDGIKCIRKKELYLVLVPAGIIFLLWPIFGYLVDWQGFWGAVKLWAGFSKRGLYDPRVNVNLFKFAFALFLTLSPPFALLAFWAFLTEGLKNLKRRRFNNFQAFLLILIAVWFIMLFLIPVKEVRHLFPILPFLSIVFAQNFGKVRFRAEEVILCLIFLVFFFPYDFLNLRKTPLGNRLYFSLYMWRIEKRGEECFTIGDYLKGLAREDEAILYTNNSAVFAYCSQRPYRDFLPLRYSEAVGMLEETRIFFVGRPSYLPYLTEEERIEFADKLEAEFNLVKIFPGGERVFVRKSEKEKKGLRTTNLGFKID